MSQENTIERTPESGLSSHALFSSLFHPDDSDRGFLMWIHERLEHIHGESRLRDYMHKLRAIIADTPADRRTISVGQGKNSLESLQEFIVENDDVVAPARSSADFKKDVPAGCHSRLRF